MKLLVLLYLTMLSSSSFAFFKRISKIECADKGNTIQLIYDSNYSSYSAKVFKINGKAPKSRMEQWSNESTIFFGKTENGNDYSFTALSDKDEFKTILKIGDQRRILNCTSGTKFKLDWPSEKNSESIYNDSRTPGKELKRSPAVQIFNHSKVFTR